MWAAILSIAALFIWSIHKLRYFSSRGVRTFPPFPLFGNLTAVTFGQENFVDTIAAGYEAFSDQRYFGLYQYHVPTLIPRDPELLRQIMVRDFNSFTDRGVHIGTECDPLFGKNLFMLQGPKWREMRNALTPAFSGARMRCMAPLMDECARAATAHLKTTIKSITEIDTDELISACVNDVIASCAFGFGVNTHAQPQNAIYRLGQTAVIQHTTQIMKFSGYENFPSLMKLLGIKIIPSDAAEQFAVLFKSALEARRQRLVVRPDFIQTLVDAAQGTRFNINFRN
ncbi:Cytochrome P450 9e2 [Eumeta japonica]|uniref:unspecific monooxygenase n=1 Tax=Eumeta variegata TaxID=151549 RepID=A0A4C1XHW0_EUMVA|nr:Cytochrome P450 9e2 [Eumeta japonica]